MERNMLYDGDVMIKHKKSKIIREIQNLLPEQSILHDLGVKKMGKINPRIVFCQNVQLFAWHFHLQCKKSKLSYNSSICFFYGYIELTIKD